MNGRKTVAIVSAGIKPYGATRSMVALIKAFESRSSYEFVVLLRRGSESVQRFLQQNGVRFLVVPFHQDVFRISTAGSTTLRFTNLLRSWASCTRSHFVNRLQARIWSRRLKEVSLVHSNNLVSGFGLELARQLGLPHVQHIREYLLEDYSIALCRENSFRKAHGEVKTFFVALSSDLKNTFISRGLVPESSVRVIHNPLQEDSFSPQQEKSGALGPEVRVCLPGRVFPGKNQLEAILALGHLRLLRPDLVIRLHIFGDADEDYKVKLETTAESLGVSDWLVFEGFSDRMLDDFQKFDIGLACSRREVFARTVIEMMASRLAVIAPNSGGFPEQILDGRTGLLYSPGDHEELADKILTIAEDKALRLTMGEKARQDAFFRFSPERFADLMGDLYEEALNQ